MRQNTIMDYVHLGIAVAISTGISAFVFSHQTWATRASLFSLLMIIYLFHFWKINSAPVQATGVHEAAPALAPQNPAMSFVAPPAQRHADPMPTRSVQNKVGNTLPSGVKPTYYQVEADTINKLLAEVYHLNARIDYLKPGTIIEAPDFVSYQIKQTGPLEFNRLQKIEDDLAREIMEQSRLGQGEEIGVMAVNSQPIVLQVTRKNPKKLFWAERPLVDHALTATVAKYWQGIKEKNLIIDLVSEDMVNGAAFGQPGSGKSTFLHISLISMLLSTPPDLLEVYAIDMKKGMFAEYEGIPHVKQTASTIEDAIGILEKFSKWCTAGNFPNDGKYRLLIIDELQMLVTHSRYSEAAMQRLKDILERGREAKLRVWTATQNPDADSYPTQLKPRTHWMSCARIMNDDYVRRQLKINGASKLRTEGEMIFVGPWGDYRVKTFFLSPEIRSFEIENIRRKWIGRLPAPAPVEVDTFVPPKFTAELPVPPEVSDLGPDVRWKLPNRDLSPSEEEAVCKLWADPRFFDRGKPSLNKVIKHVYEFDKNAKKIDAIKYALRKGGIVI